MNLKLLLSCFDIGDVNNDIDDNIHNTSSEGRFFISNADRTPPPSGMQCPLCKRDLSYTPEGPVYQPLRPPPVAVLPCHHHFHASCLERITSKDQAQNPPCIPCALGDKN